VRDAAKAAAMSDPTANFHFNRRWTDPPRRRSPALAATSNRADLQSALNTFYYNSIADEAAQRAIRKVLTRAAAFDRQADLLLVLGQIAPAKRLARCAAALREVAVWRARFAELPLCPRTAISARRRLKPWRYGCCRRLRRAPILAVTMNCRPMPPPCGLS